MNILKIIFIRKLQVQFYSLQIKIQITLASLTPTKEEVLDFSLYGIKDPDNYVDIQETAPPQHVLGISEDNPAPDTPVLSLKATNANGQKWLLVPHK